MRGEIAKGGGLLDPTVLCVDFLLPGSFLDFRGRVEELRMEEILVDRLRGQSTSSSGVVLYE